MSLFRNRQSWPPSLRTWPPPPNPDDADYIAEQERLCYEVQYKAYEIFKSPEDLSRLREATGWHVKYTPESATYRDFVFGIIDVERGVAPEAIALVLYHMAAVEHMSGERVEKHCDAVDYWYEKIKCVLLCIYWKVALNVLKQLRPLLDGAVVL